MTLAEKMRELRRTRDPREASAVSDFCRFKLGWVYGQAARSYGRANKLDLVTGAEEWEELMAEADEVSSW